MTLYQELQLNQAGSKALIKNAGNRREKQRHIGVYILKVFLTMAFCVAFISAFTALFGPENSIAGVVVLLAVMVFRQADLGIDSKQSFFVLLGIFGILSVGPHIAAVSSPITAFAVDFICIFALTFFGCHNILMSNHATFVLGYLLLSGNDVSGGAYGTRILGLMAGSLLTALIFTAIIIKSPIKDGFLTFFGNFISHRPELNGSFALRSAWLSSCLFHGNWGFPGRCGRALRPCRSCSHLQKI